MKKISSLEYNTLMFFLIRASFIEVTVNILIMTSKQDAWISVLLGSILGIIPYLIFYKFRLKYPNKSITDVSGIMKYISFIGVFIYTVCGLWNLVHFIDSQFLYKTSTWIITISVIIPLMYAISKDFHVFSKVSLIMFFVVCLFIVCIILGLIGGINVDNLKPLLGGGNVFWGAFNFVAFNVLPLCLLLIIPKDKIIGYSIKKNILFYIISCLTLINIMFLTISVFGIELASLYDYPSFHLLKRVSVLDIFDRLESILSLEWVFALFVQIGMGLFYLKDYFHKKTNNIMFIICLISAIICNFIFLTHGTEEYFFENYLIYILYFVFLIIPILLLLKKT